jgi:hypothetical protein
MMFAKGNSYAWSQACIAYSFVTAHYLASNEEVWQQGPQPFSMVGGWEKSWISGSPVEWGCGLRQGGFWLYKLVNGIPP